ncbi:unnamed protein product [Pedinophyceae sp. YPF-701]|nr:unnamed protein product [Pedinophyceae sp. YPF-701]
MSGRYPNLDAAPQPSAGPGSYAPQSHRAHQGGRIPSAGPARSQPRFRVSDKYKLAPPVEVPESAMGDIPRAQPSFDTALEQEMLSQGPQASSRASCAITRDAMKAALAAHKRHVAGFTALGLAESAVRLSVVVAPVGSGSSGGSAGRVLDFCASMERLASLGISEDVAVGALATLGVPGPKDAAFHAVVDACIASSARDR